MTKIEFSILDCAVDYWIDVYQLEASDRESIAGHSRPRGMDNEQIVETLALLFRNGDVLACNWQKALVPSNYGEIAGSIPTRAEIAYGVTTQHRFLGYKLSEQGGRRWEEAAQPRWDRLLNTSMGTNDDDPSVWTIEIEALKSGVVENYVSQARMEGCLIEGTVEQETLVPWEATYWKVLPLGFWVRYQQAEWGDVPWRLTWYQRPEYE